LESPELEPWAKIAAIVAGAGVSGALTGMVTKWIPNVAPDIVGAGAGFVIYYFGSRYHPLLGAFGVGVMAGSLKSTVEKMIPAPAGEGGGGGSGGSSSSSSSSAAENLAKAYVMARGGG